VIGEILKNSNEKKERDSLSWKVNISLIDASKGRFVCKMGLTGFLGRSLSDQAGRWQVRAYACEWNALRLPTLCTTFQRFGIDFVASPRHADVLLCHRACCKDRWSLPLKKLTLQHPGRNFVIAWRRLLLIDGGIYKGSYAVTNGRCQT